LLQTVFLIDLTGRIIQLNAELQDENMGIIKIICTTDSFWGKLRYEDSADDSCSNLLPGRSKVAVAVVSLYDLLIIC
jgi:hypothetical protein